MLSGLSLMGLGIPFSDIVTGLLRLMRGDKSPPLRHPSDADGDALPNVSRETLP
jgi:hypothetical protein